MEALFQDAIAELNPTDRIALRKDFQTAGFDLDIVQSKELLALKFGYEDTQRDRAARLGTLVKHVGSLLTKTMKVMGFVIHCDATVAKIGKNIESLIETLTDTGIDDEATLLARITNLEVNATTAGVSDENEINLKAINDNLKTVENSVNLLSDLLGNHKVSDLATEVATVKDQMDAADPAAMDISVKANQRQLTAVATRVEAIHRDLALLNDWKRDTAQELRDAAKTKRDAERNLDEAKTILEEIKDLKLLIDKTQQQLRSTEEL